MAEATASPAAGRACGTCTMCCKLLAIEPLNKPLDRWCAHCKPGAGCGIYDTRPLECRTFFCGWMTDLGFGPEWRPDRAKFLLALEASGHVVVHCDASAPTAWRREPYYSEIKSWTRRPVGRAEVLVRIGRRALFVTAQGEIDLGEMRPGDELITSYDRASRLTSARFVPRSGAAAVAS
jgi:hypothetical protein